VLYVCDAEFVSTRVFKGHEKSYTICLCRSCGLVYVGEAVTDALLGELYGAEYYQGRDATGFVDYGAQERKYRGRFAGRLERLAPHLGSPGRVLDVGCALGWFLAEATARGWQAEGLELSDYCVQFVKDRFDLPVRAAMLPDADYGDETFDFVTLWDTVEHLLDPRTTLEHAHRVLKPGGRIALSTGNVRSLRSRVRGRQWALVRPPKHLYYFSPATLGALLEDCGFEVVDTWQELPGKIPGVVRRTISRLTPHAGDIFGMVAKRRGA
jgi:SAM-dependent methyltransferase